MKNILPVKGYDTCNRKACQTPENVYWYNEPMNAFYCTECADKINTVNPGLDLCKIDLDKYFSIKDRFIPYPGREPLLIISKPNLDIAEGEFDMYYISTGKSYLNKDGVFTDTADWFKTPKEALYVIDAYFINNIH